MRTGYLEAYLGGEGELVEKKSRFIAQVRPVKSEEEAASFIEEVRKKYWDARHHCSAFSIGLVNPTLRCSDDGEPSGTAGRPMLDVITGAEVHNVCVVVTRYFGGTLLGTGGLVRAYSGAVKEGLKNSVILHKKPGQELFITCDYNGLGKLQYLAAQNGVQILDTEYTESVTARVMAPEEICDGFIKKITEATGGKAGITKGEAPYYAEHDGEILLFAE